MKKLAAILITLALMAGVSIVGSVPASARLSYINHTTTGLSISGGQATCLGAVVGYVGTTTKITITLYLERKTASSSTWTSYTSNSKTLSGSNASFEMKVSGIPSGYQYRTHAVYKAYAGSDYETLDGYSSVVSY